MIQGKPQWRVEIQASTYPVEEWVTLTRESGKSYAFVDRWEAEQEMARVKRVQPHSVLRIVPM